MGRWRKLCNMLIHLNLSASSVTSVFIHTFLHVIAPSLIYLNCGEGEEEGCSSAAVWCLC
jgi:hypothetical protein